jgi:hypothetical protein
MVTRIDASSFDSIFAAERFASTDLGITHPPNADKCAQLKGRNRIEKVPATSTARE